MNKFILKTAGFAEYILEDVKDQGLGVWYVGRNANIKLCILDPSGLKVCFSEEPAYTYGFRATTAKCVGISRLSFVSTVFRI